MPEGIAMRCLKKEGTSPDRFWFIDPGVKEKMPLLFGRVCSGTRGPFPKIGRQRIVPSSVLSANVLYHIVVIIANKLGDHHLLMS